MDDNSKTSVLYNASCPVCNFEIRHYARYSERHDLPIRFDDLNTDMGQVWGLDADTAARRLHVMHKGELLSGIPAFVVLWAQMPKYQLLARIIGLPVIKQVTSAIYDYILAPLLYRWHRHRQRDVAP